MLEHVTPFYGSWLIEVSSSTGQVYTNSAPSPGRHYSKPYFMGQHISGEYVGIMIAKQMQKNTLQVLRRPR